MSKVLTAIVPSPSVATDTTDTDSIKKDNTNSSSPRVTAVKLSNGKYVACDHFVCDEKLQSVFAVPRDCTPSTANDKVRFVQRQMVLRRPFLSPALCSVSGADGESGSNSTRGVCIFPAQTPGLDNTHAIYLLQLDESTQVAPRGTYLGYLMTYIPCSDGATADEARAVELMNRTTLMLRGILASSLPKESRDEKQNSSDEVSHQEVFYATFLHPPQAASTLSSFSSRNSSDYGPVSAYSNVHLCDNSSEQVLYVHDAVCQAEELFKSMYPDDVFLEDTEQNNAAQTR